MSDIVITAENLGKKYTIGHQAESGGYLALRDVLMQIRMNDGLRMRHWGMEKERLLNR